MISDSLAAFAAALLSALLALAVLVRRRHSVASACFVAGMLALTVDSACDGLSQNAIASGEVLRWQTFALLAKALLPSTWLAFSLTYARGNSGEFLRRWRSLIGAAFLLPLGLALGFRSNLLQLVLPARSPEAGAVWLRSTTAGKALDVVLLVAFVLILMNLEKTFRSAVGTMRWRIKFLVLGLGGIFAARIYTQSQSLLFSGHSLALNSVDTGALLIGCVLIAVAYMRSGFAEIDIYPSHAVLESSATVILVGGYLFVVGVLAQIVALLGGVQDFQTQVFFVLLGLAVLAILLFSERLRQRLRNFLSRHFGTSRHDFRKIWTLFTQRISNVLDQPGLCLASARLISETFNALSVTIWLLDQREERLVVGASTALPDRIAIDLRANSASGAFLSGLRHSSEPFDLESGAGDWADALREATPSQFRKGGNRLAVLLMAGERALGVAVLADRVNGARYSLEELDLLHCIGDQIGAALLNLRLSEDLVLAKELEAFQTMSAFFVHDLKNAASSLGLMLKNLPVHFDDPAFREDALRGIGATASRINHLIGRLSVLRNKLDLKPMELDLNQLLSQSLEEMQAHPRVEWVRNFQPLPRIFADREQLQNVFTNLLLNAAEAVGETGRVTVESGEREGRAWVSVADDGCGMSADFIRDSLFRPFQTTKKRGIGIGMFQSKMIVEAHRGDIHVQSETGKGTTFQVSLPLRLPV